MRNILIVPLVFCLVFSFSCKDDECESESNAPIVSSSTPSTAKTSETLVIPILIQCYSGCGMFLECVDSQDGNVFEIIARARYVGCYCTQDLPTRDGEYSFKVNQAGTYYLHYFNGTDVDIDTIVVTD